MLCSKLHLGFECLRQTHIYCHSSSLQLLKAVFGTNLAGQWDSHVAATALRPPVNRATTRSSAAAKLGIYHVCLNQPYIQLTQAMASTTMKLHAPQTSGTAGSTTTVEQEDSSTRLGFYASKLSMNAFA